MEKLSVSKERVIEAANKYSTAKNILMVLFPEAFEVPKPKYEVGKWYRFNDTIFRVCTISERVYCDNSNYYKNRETNDFAFGSIMENDSIPATKEEIEKHLRALADKKGFVKGVKFKGATGSDSDKEITIDKIEYNLVNAESGGLYCKNSYIYYENVRDGRSLWATIIEEPKTYTFTKEGCDGVTEITFKSTSEKEANNKLSKIVGCDYSNYTLKSTN